MDAQLELADGSLVPITDGLVLGRLRSCDVVLDDTKASRKHARFVVEGGVVEVEDLGSSNGTLLNGRPVQRRIVRDGDLVQIGTTVLAVRLGAAGSDAAQPSGGSGATAPGEDLFTDAGDPLAIEETAPEPERRARPAPPPDDAPPAEPSEVIEFVDEVVEVRKREPERPRSTATSRAATGAPAVARRPHAGRDEHGVLQFQRRPDRGVLGEDLTQMSAGMRVLVFAGMLAAAAAVAWLIAALIA